MQLFTVGAFLFFNNHGIFPHFSFFTEKIREYDINFYRFVELLLLN